MFLSIGEIVKRQQPDVYKTLILLSSNQVKVKFDNLSFEDYERMMRHDSFKRVHGAIRRR
jgi:hypothetical protein